MMNINKREQELIDEVFENFDFDEVHKAMKLMNWKWISYNGYEIPSLERIKSSARARIEGAIECAKNSKRKTKDIEFFSSSGGIKASAWKNIYGQITNIQLQFILKEWQAGED